MFRISQLLPAVSLIFLLASCSSVISRQVRDESLPALPLKTLVENVRDYRGKTVILGGYILRTENSPGTSTVWVLQTPLDSWQTPTEKDKSEGRLVVSSQSFLDPKIYQPDRRITVAGTIEGLSQEDAGLCVFPCLKLASREIYLWPEITDYDYFLYEDPYYYYPDGGYDSFWYPYYYRNPRYYPAHHPHRRK